ncbi:MAG: hypothetical protein JO264_05255 [Acidisphaera sp.]|nr:hypothetical protein [Acidisphaera sp.]
MGNRIRLNLQGLDRVGPKTASEVVVMMREVMGPLVTQAGKTLVITLGSHRGDLNLDFDSTTDTRAAGVCTGHGVSILGEDAGESVFVRAHRDLRVCGPVDPKTRRKDTRKILTAFWLLGPALGNTGIHELGHFIADLQHVNDPGNFMSTMGPALDQRTMATQREFWAGKKTFNDEQKKKLVKQIGEGKWLLDITFGP